MKKLLVSLVLGLFLISSSVVYAGTVSKTIISGAVLDDSPTSVTSTTVNISEWKNVTFYVNYDETEVGGGVSGAVSLDISYDGTNWVDVSFYDFAGGSTPQSSETISADGWYACWLPENITSLYVRMVIAGTNTDVDDTIELSVYMVGER